MFVFFFLGGVYILGLILPRSLCQVVLFSRRVTTVMVLCAPRSVIDSWEDVDSIEALHTAKSELCRTRQYIIYIYGYFQE